MTSHHVRFLTAVGLGLMAVMMNASAQSSSKLLGVPFGEKLTLTQCPPNTDKARSPCWIDKPFYYKPTGSKSGYVHLPGAKERPDWAANAMFQISQDKEGRVQELKINTFSPQNRIQVAESISGRFGKPVQDELRKIDIAWATWRSREGVVEMRCKDECWIEFRTPAAQAAREEELAERARTNAARPKTP
jgi:hypothetical protein